MLILARKCHEKIVIALDGQTLAEITVVKVQGASVRLGIDAPPGVKIWRKDGPPRDGERQ